MVGMLFGIMLLLAIGYFAVLCVTELALWLGNRTALRALIQPQRLAGFISQVIVR